MGKLDPDTGKVIEYPMPYTDNGMRDFFLDKDGRMWFGTPPNNKDRLLLRLEPAAQRRRALSVG